MGTTTKPTLLLVPGAWFPASVFDPLIKTLQNYSFEDIVVAPYPSIDPQGDPNEADCGADTAHIGGKYLRPLVEAGKDVVVFAHSYGGMPAAGAAASLSKRTRSKDGKTGGVIGLIMASAFVVSEGVSCAGAMGGDTPSWVLKDNPRKGLCWPDDPRKMFALDVPEPEAESTLKILVPHATIAFFSNQPKPIFSEPEFKGLFAYIKQMNDEAVPVAGQEAMLQYSGVEWITRELPFSHNAGFITKTEVMAETIKELVELFGKNA